MALVKKNDFISRILGLFKKINSRSQRGGYFIRFLYFCYRKPSQCCIFFLNKILQVWLYEKDYAIPTQPEHVRSTLSVIGEDFFQASVRLYDYMCIGRFVAFSSKTFPPLN